MRTNHELGQIYRKPGQNKAYRRTMSSDKLLGKLMRADKAKVTDEIWDEERIQSFLNKPAMGQEPEHYSQLLFAYRSMRPEDFGRFIKAFVAGGGDVNAKSKDGLTLAQVIKDHQKSAAFTSILQQHN